MKKQSIEERLKTIRKAFGNTVLVTIGLKKEGAIDIIEVNNTFRAPDDESDTFIGESLPKKQDLAKRFTYIG